MSHPNPHYMECVLSAPQDRKDIYYVCLDNLLHTEYSYADGNLCEFKAAALTSIILKNKDLHKNASHIIAYIDWFDANTPAYGVDVYEWSMHNVLHKETIESTMFHTHYRSSTWRFWIVNYEKFTAENFCQEMR